MTNVTQRPYGGQPPMFPNQLTGNAHPTIDVSAGKAVGFGGGVWFPCTAIASVPAGWKALAILSSDAPEGGQVRAQFAGPVTLTVEQWNQAIRNADASTDGLVEGNTYYVDETSTTGTLGRITDDLASFSHGAGIIPVGIAMSPTTLMVNIGHATENP